MMHRYKISLAKHIAQGIATHELAKAQAYVFGSQTWQITRCYCGSLQWILLLLASTSAACAALDGFAYAGIK